MEKLATCLVLVLPIGGVSARSWESLVLPTELGLVDADYLLRHDPFFENMVFRDPSTPTDRPTDFPTMAPTDRPSTSPSTSPTSQPSSQPSSSPSAIPTVNPDPYPPIPVPANPPSIYFNYDVQEGSMYGPGEMALIDTDGGPRVGIKNNHWGSVDTVSNSYWKEFTDDGWGAWKGLLEKRDVLRNVCETGTEQSPIDLRPNGAICYETHEVRSETGDYRLTDDKVQKQIQSNKLRLLYERRPCADFKNDISCQEPDPPFGDFPNGFTGFADVMHIDFKVPSEHKMNGEQFDAEMQIFHLHNLRRRMPTQSVLIRAEDGSYNPYFQTALDAFQTVHTRKTAQCTLRQRRERQLVSDVHAVLGQKVTSNVDYATWADISTEFDRPDYEEHAKQMERQLGEEWDPHSASLIPTIYFYRYDGSLTEPPCGEWVSWFVADKPMKISPQQLEQMKTILFTSFDENCNKLSVHFAHSVARPIRPVGNRPVSQCTDADFDPDP